MTSMPSHKVDSEAHTEVSQRSVKPHSTVYFSAKDPAAPSWRARGLPGELGGGALTPVEVSPAGTQTHTVFSQC